ncbi:MAG TPA: energy transducer TonB [Asticcacaulis sp.]|nr:energy transducer TonB [Asticcacaulis sp.]
MPFGKTFAAILVLGALTACATDAPEVSVDPPTAEIQASKALPVEWASFINHGIIAHYYPRKAWDAQEDGLVYVSCAWDGKGKVTNCRVLREAPAGFGFGAATVEMLRDVGLVRSKDRSKPIEAGEGLVIGIAWHNRG